MSSPYHRSHCNGLETVEMGRDGCESKNSSLTHDAEIDSKKVRFLKYYPRLLVDFIYCKK